MSNIFPVSKTNIRCLKQNKNQKAFAQVKSKENIGQIRSKLNSMCLLCSHSLGKECHSLYDHQKEILLGLSTVTKFKVS